MKWETFLLYVFVGDFLFVLCCCFRLIWVSYKSTNFWGNFFRFGFVFNTIYCPKSIDSVVIYLVSVWFWFVFFILVALLLLPWLPPSNALCLQDGDERCEQFVFVLVFDSAQFFFFFFNVHHFSILWFFLIHFVSISLFVSGNCRGQIT